LIVLLIVQSRMVGAEDKEKKKMKKHFFVSLSMTMHDYFLTLASWIIIY